MNQPIPSHNIIIYYANNRPYLRSILHPLRACTLLEQTEYFIQDKPFTSEIIKRWCYLCGDLDVTAADVTVADVTAADVTAANVAAADVTAADVVN
ncbi:hypothetical protein E4K67_01355 [Desulfosporosinus fructosivorans]|uniref:Uncharacterized protein n=1 Tax=Desulfosporosinus fructosivorans TaxID=2018669 RepID=A0A4Z0RBH3_9FIRM|nr:hypothetical protein [Desulfosporosinus fructosivorans]TGE39675.1 hypothetical protein E4K67_01355 [Desulfosporosinus fructosivorans]